MLNPAPSDYQKRIFYQTYDVTRQLLNGTNTMGVILGNGWYNLVIPHALRYYAADYIEPPRMILQLDIFYADGSRESVVSDESWKFTTDGPIRFNSLISGETYDERMEIPGWNINGYDDQDWKAALPAGTPAGKLEAQMLYPVRVVDTVRAVRITPIPSGYSVDLEKEITGWCNIRVKGKSGQKVTVRFPGMGSHTLGRYQTYEYILKSGEAVAFDARFSYNGIKTIELFGLDYMPDLEDIKGISANTDFPRAGTFSCSNEIFNEMYGFLEHTVRNYVVHIPNDPVREKAGWTQDVENAFDITAYSQDCRSMYIKWQHDFLDIIHENGYVPPVTPGRFDGPTINCPWWGGMIVYLPWKIWEYFGDRKILEESFEAMKKYTGYLESIDSARIINWGLGDWLEPGSVRPVMTPVPFTSTVGYYNTAMITSKTAAILGYQEDSKKYAALAEEIKAAFNRHFFNPSTGEYAKYSQTSQLLPLVFNMVPEDSRELVEKKLVEKIKEWNNHPGTGFIGTPFLLNGLSNLGLGELAYTLADQRTYPSWYDMVYNHGTKIFKEDWAGGAVQMPPLGGGLGWWFFYGLGGIRPDPEHPGFRNVIIKPDMVSGLDHASATYRSVYGLIRSEWKREKGQITLEVEIPANTTATVYLPAADPKDGYTVKKVGSGHHSYTLPVNTHYFEPGKVWYDTDGVPINAHGGGVIHYEGRYYWFGEHKIAGPDGNKSMVGFSCYSSENLYDWKNEGIALKVSEDTASPIRKGCVMERPKVIYNKGTGQFVMWFHHELYGTGYKTASSGIAVASKITGPYTYLKTIRPNAGYWPVNVQDMQKMGVPASTKDHYGGGPGGLSGHPDSMNLLGRDFTKGQMARDMTLFVDQDGKAYHVYASEENSTLQISILTDDYLNSSGTYARAFVGRYMEAPALFYHQGKYFFIGSDCTGWEPNAARSAVASNILGPWTELGNPCRGTDEENAKTFWSQSTYILPVEGKEGAFIFMADRWNPKNPIDGRYVWLPVQFDESGNPTLKWLDRWSIEEQFPNKH
jgi:hypothetical protein